jgi:hypothetical protein
MKCNVGGVDRLLRIVLGLVIIALGIFYGSLMGLIGIIPLFTGIFKVCPVYIPFKFSTCKTSDGK